MENKMTKNEQEVATITERTLILNLSDADSKRVFEKAASVGLSLSELFENFVGDLVGGTFSNGSDEHMYAQNWFERCGFRSFTNFTFLQYLIDFGGLDDVTQLYEDIQDARKEITYLEERPEAAESGEKDGWQEDIDCWQEQLADYFTEYKQFSNKKYCGTLEEEMQRILNYKAEYEKFLGED